MSNSFKTNIYKENNGSFAEDKFLTNKDNIGVCFSGGGSRAHVLAMGQLRGLEALGLMKNMKYISSVSGGTWASTEYAYRKDDDTKALLGVYEDPKDLTLKGIEKKAPKMAEASIYKIIVGKHKVSPFVYHFLLNLDQVMKKKLEETKLWEASVGDTFLKPFELLEDFSSDLFSLNAQTQESFETLNPEFKKQTQNIMLLNKLSPYLIVNGTMTQPVGHTTKDKTSDDFIGIQFTPLYTDIPYKANSGKTPKYSGSSIKPINIGDGAIESLVYGSTPASVINDNQININQASSPLGLSAIAGISSNFMGGMVSNLNAILAEIKKIYLFVNDSKYSSEIRLIESSIEKTIENHLHMGKLIKCLKDVESTGLVKFMSKKTKILIDDIGLSTPIQLNPKLYTWSPLATPKAIPQSAEFSFADGGCMDNYGIMPLLRRNVKKIAVFINTFSKLGTSPVSDYTDMPEDYLDFNLPSLFGCVKLTNLISAMGTDITHNQVFNKLDFKNVLLALQTKKNANEAVRVTTTHTVLENEWWGIAGGYDVEVCWVYNEEVLNWEKELSPEIQKDFKIGNDRDTEKPTEFPMYGTISCTAGGFSTKEANLLAHLAAWNVAGSENKDDFIKLFQNV